MPNITENLWNSTRDSSLYCAWVPVHDDGGDRLVAIWIGTGAVDADITYLFRVTARAEQEAHMRALLLHSIGGQPLLLKSLKSDDVEYTDKVEVRAILTSTGRQNVLLEHIVSRLSLEPGVSGVSWEIVAEQE